MDEKDFYEALGVEPEGGNEPEVAEPAGADVEEMQNAEGEMQNDEGEEAEDIAEDGEEGTSSTASGPPSPRGDGVKGEDEETTPPSTAPTPPLAQGRLEEQGQSKEDNARFAAARRRAEAERDAEVKRVREEAKAYADAQIAEVLKTAGFKNPYTGEDIRTMAEFNAYTQKLREEQKNAVMQGSGMSEEQFRAFMEGSPEVQEARRIKLEAEATLREAKERAAREKVDAQIREISEMNPAVKTLEDLAKLPNYPEIYAKVKSGYSIVDAYKLLNLGEIEARAAKRARQEVRNAAQSKNHLEKTVDKGTGRVEVPEDVKVQYRMLDPDITDEEIQKHYASYARRSN